MWLDRIRRELRAAAHNRMVLALRPHGIRHALRENTPLEMQHTISDSIIMHIHAKQYCPEINIIFFNS